MSHGLTVLGEAALRFFGKMSAANSHEIKNALAVINEVAGLLEDLIAMTGKGIPLNPERLKQLAEKIKKQIDRADEIAKSNNLFAHSLDKAHGPSDLAKSLVLIKTMAMRFATQRHISIEIVSSLTKITLPVPPFMLLHLLWLCLNHAMQATDAEKTLQVVMEKNDREVLVRYGPLSHLDQIQITAFKASPELNALLEHLKARIRAKNDTDELVLSFSKQELTC